VNEGWVQSEEQFEQFVTEFTFVPYEENDPRPVSGYIAAQVLGIVSMHRMLVG